MAVTALEHVLVLADDIDGTRDFYTDVLGLQAGARPPLPFPGYWMYTENGSTSCLHIADRDVYLRHAATMGLGHADPDDPDGRSSDGVGQRADTGMATVDHLAFEAADHDATRASIVRAGLTPVPNELPNGIRQLFVRDPNGVLVEINVKPAPEST